MKNKAQSFWDKQAKTYENNERKFDPLFKEVLAKTKKFLNPNDQVLDFGCASGTKTLELAGGVRHLHGLDYSAEMVKEANKKKKEANVMNCSFSQGTIFTNNIDKEAFDKIISYGVIHLLEEDKERVIQRIYELLKPGGLFISTTPCLKERMSLKTKLEFFAFMFIKKLGIFPLHLNMFKNNHVERLITNQGFKIVESKEIFHGITMSFIVAKKE